LVNSLRGSLTVLTHKRSLSYVTSITLKLHHVYFCFIPYFLSEFQIQTPFPFCCKILLVLNKWVVPSLNNTNVLKLFVDSVLVTTSDATLTSSHVRWKTLLKVRSFCAPGLPRLKFALDWETSSAYSL